MIKWLEENLAPLEQMGSKMDESESEAKTHVKALKENNEKEHYDLFISYSHQNSEKAEKLREGIASIFPNWKIFIDVSGLKTGTAWQNRLYSSIGKYI